MFSRSLIIILYLWNFSHGYTLPSKHGDQNWGQYFSCALISAVEELPHILHPSMQLALLFGSESVNSCSMCVQYNMQIPFCRIGAHLEAPLLL